MSSWCRLTVSRPVGVSLLISFRSRSMWWVPWTLVLRIGFVGRCMQRRLARMFRVPPWIICLCRNSCFLALPYILELLCVRGVSCGFPILKCWNFRLRHRPIWICKAELSFSCAKKVLNYHPFCTNSSFLQSARITHRYTRYPDTQMIR